MESADTRAALAAIGGGTAGELARLLEAAAAGDDGLDARCAALVRIATLIALDAPPASYAWHVASAIEAGAEAEEILGVLRVVAPEVGTLKAVAAAPEVMLALGMTLPDDSG